MGPTKRVGKAADDEAARRRRLRAAGRDAKACRRCDLWRTGTQTVFGAGDVGVSLMLVGEQPGDVEDKEGLPFVGPAGRVLAEALEEAGLTDVPKYVTNAVKHFKWEPRGKRRLHMKPNTAEVMACRFWLEEEIAAVQPTVLVALGAVAARAIIGPRVRVMKDRGTWLTSALAPHVTVTVHPSSILRAPDADARRTSMAAFVADLRSIARRLKQSLR
jgi:uracil-DNA glycosylase family protein